nr:MAG TPA: hypothetical protein [Caudoviricetes sp.]
MKRKTLVKQLMALGASRNAANATCRRVLASRDYSRARGWREVRVTWEYCLKKICEDQAAPQNVAPKTAELLRRSLFFTWIAKRSKANPVYSWAKNHPNNI